MSSVTEDVLKGVRARRTRNGWERERQFTVVDVTVVTDLLQDAADDAGVPQIGAEFPTDDTLILVEQIPRALTTTSAEIRLLYRVPKAGDVNPTDPDATQIEVGTVTRSVETNEDLDGSILEVDWSGAPDDQKPQRGTITKDFPTTTFVFRRNESASPEDKSVEYVPSINKNAFRGYPPGTWKCTGITGSSDDNEETFDVVHTFEYSEEGWQQKLLWIDPDTGKQPGARDGNPAPSEGDGIETKDLYQELDWSELNIA